MPEQDGPMPIIVRAATAADATVIVAFQIAMARETEGGLELDPATVTAGVGAVFADARIGRYYAAEVDGRLVASLLTLPEWSDWRNGTVLWIHSVYVLPDHRRRGVFRAMHAHLRKLVEGDSTLRGLRLYVHRDNAAAQRTYAELGMDGEHYRLFEWMKTF